MTRLPATALPALLASGLVFGLVLTFLDKRPGSGVRSTPAAAGARHQTENDPSPRNCPSAAALASCLGASSCRIFAAAGPGGAALYRCRFDSGERTIARQGRRSWDVGGYRPSGLGVPAA